MVLHLRRQPSSNTSPWETQISPTFCLVKLSCCTRDPRIVYGFQTMKIFDVVLLLGWFSFGIPRARNEAKTYHKNTRYVRNTILHSINKLLLLHQAKTFFPPAVNFDWGWRFPVESLPLLLQNTGLWAYNPLCVGTRYRVQYLKWNPKQTRTTVQNLNQWYVHSRIINRHCQP